MVKEFQKGPKTFILGADPSVTPDSADLQILFGKGYEVYVPPETRLLSLGDQIRCLAKLFEEVIIFITIEVIENHRSTGESEVTFPLLPGGLGNLVHLGVFHHESDPDVRSLVENYYILEAQVQAGCIFIERSRTADISKIQRVLAANEANGRRKAIRMPIHGRFNTVYKGNRLEGTIAEISASHFQCIFKGEDPKIEESEHLTDVQLFLNGPVLMVDTIVMMKRIARNPGGYHMIYIFGFLHGDFLGLDLPDTRKLLEIIQSRCTQTILEVVQREFQKKRKQRIGSGHPTETAETSKV